MLLEESAIDGMRQIIGLDAGIVLLCRNPVKRLLSAVKLMNVYNGMNLTQTQADDWVRRMMDENTTWMQAQDKYNDYEKAILRFSERFPHFVAVSYDQLIERSDEHTSELQSLMRISYAVFCLNT